MARSPRFERGTTCLEGRCSIQLSYERTECRCGFGPTAEIDAEQYAFSQNDASRSKKAELERSSKAMRSVALLVGRNQFVVAAAFHNLFIGLGPGDRQPMGASGFFFQKAVSPD